MTELEWKLSKENVQLTKALAQMNFNEAERRDKELGEKWMPQPEKVTAIK